MPGAGKRRCRTGSSSSLKTHGGAEGYRKMSEFSGFAVQQGESCSAASVRLVPSPYSARLVPLRPWIATSAPLSARNSAIFRPIPREEPVTHAFLPCRDVIHHALLRLLLFDGNGGRFRDPCDPEVRLFFRCKRSRERIVKPETVRL